MVLAQEREKDSQYDYFQSAIIVKNKSDPGGSWTRSNSIFEASFTVSLFSGHDQVFFKPLASSSTHSTLGDFQGRLMPWLWICFIWFHWSPLLSYSVWDAHLLFPIHSCSYRSPFHPLSLSLLPFINYWLFLFFVIQKWHWTHLVLCSNCFLSKIGVS